MSGEWTVEVDGNVCVGNQMCVSLAPEAFEMVDGVSTPHAPRMAPSRELIDAYESCPVSAIVLRDEDGQEIPTDI
jgi:ferredoxin